MRDRAATLAITWWAVIRGYGLQHVVGGMGVVTALLAVLPESVTLPEARSTVDIAARTTLFGSLALAILALSATYEAAPQIARVSPRGWRAMRLVRMSAVTLGGVVLLSAIAPDGATYSVGLLLTLVGEGLLTARLVGSGLSWLLPTAHVLAAAVVGTDVMGEPMTWAWILGPDFSSWSLLLGLATYAMGVASWSAVDVEWQ